MNIKTLIESNYNIGIEKSSEINELILESKILGD